MELALIGQMALNCFLIRLVWSLKIRILKLDIA